MWLKFLKGVCLSSLKDNIVRYFAIGMITNVMLLDHEKAFHTITRRCQWKLLASMKLIQTWFKSNIFSNFRKLFLFLWSFWCSLPEDYVIRTAWKVSKYGFFSGPHFLVFGLNTAICRVNLRTEKRLRIWTLFTYCGSLLFFSSVNEHCL